MPVLSLFKRRPACWQAGTAADYRAAYHRFGGSVITHPDMIAALERLCAIEVDYRLFCPNGKLLGAVALWEDKYLVGDKRLLKKRRKRDRVDSGNAEVILPFDRTAQTDIGWLGARFISELHCDQFTNLRRQEETLSLARPFPDGFSRKFRYNRRRELRLFEQDGGTVISFDQLDDAAIAEHYIGLFHKRWGKKPKGYELLHQFIPAVRSLLKGHLLLMNDRPVAIQLVYLAKTCRGVSAEYVNGGVDPAFSHYSPGSILSYLNLEMATATAAADQLPLRYSFGITDKEYKDTWCAPHPVYRC